MRGGRKPISISEDSIKDYEEAFPPLESTVFSSEDSSIQSTSSQNTAGIPINKDDIINIKPTQVSQETTSTCSVPDVENNNSISEQEKQCNEGVDEESFTQSDDQTTSKTEIRVGNIKLTSLGKIDLSNIPTTKNLSFNLICND